MAIETFEKHLNHLKNVSEGRAPEGVRLLTGAKENARKQINEIGKALELQASRGKENAKARLEVYMKLFSKTPEKEKSKKSK